MCISLCIWAYALQSVSECADTDTGTDTDTDIDTDTDTDTKAQRTSHARTHTLRLGGLLLRGDGQLLANSEGKVQLGALLPTAP